MLVDANIPYEEDVVDKYTDVFEYPILQGPARPAEQVSLWESAMNLVLLQREWADNAVSNTLPFRPMWQLMHIIEDNYEEELAQYVGINSYNLCAEEQTTEYIVPERYKIKFVRAEGLVKIEVYEYDPKHEENDVEAVLSAIAPLTKSVALLPHSSKGAYKQMPEEGISKEEYLGRKAVIKPIDWSALANSDGMDEQYCTGDFCNVIRS